MSQKLLLIALGVLSASILAILFGGVLLGHKGLFEVGAELAKYVFAAIGGALVSLFATKKV